ncbi:acetylxylan esterase [Echinicola jeungdonensis]|uniref:Alpha/beta hydrolase family protein n=1 Tax=Echinicola jeungdonensis TaxID=709343 RepID=A0ABV5J661_9BACT|nr:acetylxylan esterase [Echinicola jeungdonensis]MDN3669365.1 acetylxylan esterase [Echinicola jeungdonensis]
MGNGDSAQFQNKYMLNTLNLKAFFLTSMLCATIFLAKAQDSDQAYRNTLKATLDRIEDVFEINLQYNEDLVEGKELDYAFWRIVPGNLETSLAQVLAPFDLTFFEKPNALYRITKFDYPRRSVSFGEDHLNYLSGLYSNKMEWESRKAEMKSCLIEALGIDDLPETPASQPIITQRRKYKGYSVENVALEVLPGVYTTGSVYKPRPFKKNHPVIITPNGHFGQGRYRESEQIRCSILAKMGAVVVSYDLFAWGESRLQFPSTAHKTSIAHTIQTWNGIKWLDYLTSLPETDPDKVGITGGSGGGSQTMLLTAIDDRIEVSVPVVMLSSHFSGGCPCESGKPIHLCGGGTNNAEIAAMASPKPLLVISDGGDWTHTVPELEFPFIEYIYGFYGEKDKVKNSHFPEEGHNYKVSKRQSMYPFMAKYLGLDIEKVLGENGLVKEDDVTLESEEELKVFGKDGEDLPKGAIKGLEALYHMLEKAQ